MKRHCAEIVLGVIFLGVFLAFWFWQSPSWISGKLTEAEIDRYFTAIDKLPFPPADKRKAVDSLRAWARADDGKPVYMLNLMRFYPQIRSYPGAPSITGTPEESNRFYEDKVMPLLFKIGGYPLAGGSAQSRNLVGHEPAEDEWNRVLMVRYPSRRAFLSLMADPAYAPNLPYKIMALHLALVPVNGDVVIPDLRWVVGATLLILFLAIGWFRSSRRRSPSPDTTRLAAAIEPPIGRA